MEKVPHQTLDNFLRGWPLPLFLVSSIFLLWGCGPKHVPTRYGAHGTLKPYRIGNKTYYPLPSSQGFVETGYASWYGSDFHGHRTASGEIYNMYDMTAAHKILPMDSYVRVENLENGRSVVVRINDRGPFVRNRIIDLSYQAAKRLGIVGPGTAKVRITALGEAKAWRHGKLTFAQDTDFIRGDFYVQVGAFKNAKNAYNLKSRLQKYYPAVKVASGYTNGALFFKVQVDAPDNYEQAKIFERQIEEAGFPSAFLVAR